MNEFGNVNLKSEANEKAEKVEQNKGLVYASYLDIACRVLFPAIFAIFNIIYWVYFCDIFFDTADTCIFADQGRRSTVNRVTLWIVTSWLVKLIDTISSLKLYFTPDSILPVSFTPDTAVGT